jgi:thiamine phosphate synthase YjbQ (UPF0047 family)
MRSEVIRVRTGASPRVHDLTEDCARFVVAEQDGLLNVFVPHATAGVAIIETGAGSDDDLLAAIERLLPRDVSGRHRHGSPGHGRDHVLPAFIAPYATVRCWPASYSSAPGNRSAWSTPTSTTRRARSG